MNSKQVQVGDDVFYVARGSADGVFPPVDRAAKVTEVHTPDDVGLVIFNPTGLYFERHIIYSGNNRPGSWHW